MQGKIGNYQEAIMWLEQNYWDTREEMNFYEGLELPTEEEEKCQTT